MPFESLRKSAQLGRRRIDECFLGIRRRRWCCLILVGELQTLDGNER